MHDFEYPIQKSERCANINFAYQDDELYSEMEAHENCIGTRYILKH